MELIIIVSLLAGLFFLFLVAPRLAIAIVLAPGVIWLGMLFYVLTRLN